jgi:hypothetical protein
LSKKPEERFANVRAFVTALGVAGQSTARFDNSYSLSSQLPTRYPGPAPVAPTLAVPTPVQPPAVALSQEAYQPTVPSKRGYKALCRQLEQGGATGPYDGALVVRVPEQQVGQLVYLQIKYAWHGKTRKELQFAQVQRYTVEGFTITAAVFQHVGANSYMVWLDQQQAVEVLIRSSKAGLLDL